MLTKTYIKRIFPTLFFVSFLLSVKGQSNCQELLNTSSQAYADGKYELVVNLLEGKIFNCNFDKLEIEQATKILSAAYAKLGEDKLASELVFGLLKKNPTYQVQTTSDPQPFISVFNNFNIKQRLSVGLNLGQSRPIIDPVKSYPVLIDENSNHKYTASSSFLFSVSAQYKFSNNISVLFEPILSSIAFKDELNYNDQVKISYTENSPFLQLPISLGYKIYQRNKISLSLLGGIQGTFFGQTQSKLSYELEGSGIMNATGFDNLQRKKFQPGWQTGLKLEYNKSRYNFNIQANYGAWFKDYALKSSDYATNNLITDYNYYPNQLKLQNLNFKIGVSYILSYKVKHKY